MNYVIKVLCLMVFISLNANGQVADFTTDVVSGCNPLLVSFTDKSTGTSSSTIYAWDFGDSKTSSLASPSTTYTAAGTYTVKLSVKNGSTGTASTKTTTITVYPLPIVSFTATPATGCPCTNVTFTNTTVPSVPGTYTSLWSFGDGGTSTGKDPTHNFCVTGKYDVALKITNGSGCVDTKIETAKVTIWEKPVADFTASRTELCKLPDSTVFTSSPSKGKAPYTYLWDFGDLGTSTLANPKHVYTVAGIYSVKLIITDANGCKDTLNKIDYINASKFSSFSAINECLGNTSTFYNTSKTTAISTDWDFGDGFSASGISSVTHYYATSGTYTVRMSNKFAGGCLDTIVKSYTIYPKPKPDFSYSPIYSCPAPATVNFTNKSIGATSYVWIFGDGTTSTALNPSHTYTKDSIYIAYLIAKSSFGCLDTFRVRDTNKVFPGGYPKKFYDSSNSPILIRVYSADTKVSVNFDSGCLSVPVNPSITIFTHTYLPLVSDSSKFPVCLSRSRGYNYPFWDCKSVPHPDPYPDPYYDPRYVLPDSSVPYPIGISSYSWDFGDGFTSTLKSPSHIYTTEGKYTIRVTVVTDSGCIFSDSIKIMRGTQPIANFIIPDTVCMGTSVKMINKSTDGIIFFWCPGDIPCVMKLDTLPFGKAYNIDTDSIWITLIVSRYGCMDDTSRLLRLKPPSSHIGRVISCDTPLLVHLSGFSWRATSILWKFGDGDSSTALSPSHTYSSPGTYVITRKAVNDTFGCSVTASEVITLKDPKPDFWASDTTLCKGATTTFSVKPESFYIGYRWLINKEDIGSEYGPISYKFTDTGSYTIKLVARDLNGCNDTLTKTNYIIVGQPITQIIASPLKGCAPLNVSFKDSSIDTKGTSIVNRFWTWGDASSSTSGSPATASHTYTTEGVYHVQLVSTDNIGCTDTATIAVDSRKPVASFVSSVDSFGCIGFGITFTNLSTGVGLSYLWDFGDGSTSTSMTPIHSYSKLGSYTVKLNVIDDFGCKDSISKSGYITLTKPTASFYMSDTTAFCPPLFDTFTNTSIGAISYLWDFDNGSTSLLKSPVGFFFDTGRYNVRLISTNEHGCADTAQKLVKVFGYRGALKYSPLYGCAPWTVNFEIEQLNAPEMIIDFADGVTESVIGKKTTSHTYKTPGAYKPQLIFGDGKDCKSFSIGIDTIKVDGITPYVTYTSACVGAPITFNDSSYSVFSKYYSSLWIFDDKTKSILKNPTRVYDKAGVYPVKLIAENTSGCEDSILVYVTVHPLPKITTKDTTICLGDQIELNAYGGLRYYWSPNPSLSCSDCNNPIAKPSGTTKYYVIGTDSNGCQNKSTLTLKTKTKATVITGKDTAVCKLTPIQLLASGAEKYNWSPSTFLDNPDIPNPIATMDSSIIYRVIGFEAACIPDTGFVKVLVHPLPDVDAGQDQKVIAGSVVQLYGSGKNIKDYLWTPSANLSCSTCTSPKTAPLSSKIIFTLKGTSQFGCSASDDVIIDIFCDQSQLFIPNTFTPNGDGLNDYFYPQGKGVGKIKSFIVNNRWGQKVYERTNIDANVKEQGWDGTFKGEAQSPDTFVYTVEASCDNGETLFWKGDVTLIK